jgi:hypothetical protein
MIAATLFVVIQAFEEMQKRRKGVGEDVAEDTVRSAICSATAGREAPA